MPDPAVIRVMNHFRRQVIDGETQTLRRMVSQWRNVERALRAEAIELALEVTALRASGHTVPRWRLLQMQRTRDLLEQVQEQIRLYAVSAGELLSARQLTLLNLGIEASAAAIEAMAPGLQFNRLPIEAIQNMVGLAGDGSPLRETLEASYPHGADGILDEMVRGVATGKGPREIARSAIRHGLSRSLNHMMTVARTETLRAYREATRQGYIRSGVVAGYKRLSARDRRTCAGCLSADGAFYMLDEPFASHPLCRCTLVPQIIGADNDIGSGAEWFEGQSEAVQREILGPTRMELFRRGIPFDRFGTRREDARWGASYVPATVREVITG